jgi:hypothetical protein
MTAASYTSDQTTIFNFDTTSGVSAYGGGGSGLSAAYDFGVEGPIAAPYVGLCVDKQVSGAEKGLMYDNGSNFTIGADDHFYIWIRVATPGVCDTRDNRGVVVNIGDDTSNFVKFHVNGSDTLPLGGTWPYAVRFTNTTLSNFRTLVGTPSTTPSWIGGGANITSTVKSANLGVDIARIGTGFDILGGTGADDPGTFFDMWFYDQFYNRKYGIITFKNDNYEVRGKLRFGSASTECEFEDTGSLVAMADTFHSLSDFNEILIENASSIFTCSATTFQGLGTNSPGRFEMITSSATVNLTSCKFSDWGDIVLGTGATCLVCTFINTDTITANGANLTGSKVSGYEVAADTSPLIWNTATDPDGLLDDMDFTKGTLATHAIEFGTSSPTTINLVGQTFTGYNVSNGQNDSTFHVLRTTGTVTIYHLGTSGNLTYKTAGATVIIKQAPVTLELHVISQSTGSDISGARAYITAGATGPLPYQDSVTISRVTTTATVAHTAHGLESGDKVFIEGADQDEYNGVKTISNVSTNAYDYTVSGTPTTPATGTITSTAVIIDGTTSAGGLISDTRSYASDQSYLGRVRQSSSPPFYKTSPLSGTIDFETGASVIVQMVEDQ